MDDSIYWAHLTAVEGMGAATFEALIKRFGSIQRAMAASIDQLKEIPSLDERTAEAIRHAHLTLDATREKIEELESKGMRVLTSLDNAYPARLRQAANPPPVIFQAGKWEAQDNLAVAIIGSRECSAVSAKRAREYARFLAERGLTIVSGYADGVDINAHRGALEAGGRTIIIPGCGADHFDFGPLSDVGVASFLELGVRGVWLSEQPPEADWSGQGSLARNRLVAALAQAVLVIEAALNSSTLDTVARARNLKRPLFAQSYSTISPPVMGNEQLIKEGAQAIGTKAELDQIVELVKGKQGKGKKKPEDPRR
ncbi:MAG TPA: DNA-processing protein DprA [bacterium]|jgi:DNA processing protein